MTVHVYGRRSAFSLIEMVVAVTIFSMTVGALLGAFALNVQSAGTGLYHTRASFLAQGLIEETLVDDLIVSGFEEGDCSELLPEGSWEREISATDLDALYEIRVRILWNERGSEQDLELHSLVAER
jgi:hypothetical protein